VVVQAIGPTTNLVQVNSTNAPLGRSQNVFLDVIGEPIVTKTYDVPAQVPTASTALYSVFNLTISIENRRASAEQMRFTDNLPSQLVVVQAFPVTCSLASDCLLSCPNYTATAGSSTIIMNDEIMQPLTTCVYRILLNATSPGETFNFLSVIGGNFNASTGWVPLFVLESAVVSKRYSSDSFGIGGPVLLTIDIRNRNDFPMIGAQFIDTFPINVRGPATPQAVISGFGCPTATVYGDRFELLPSIIPSLARCTYQALLTGAVAGDSNNTVCASASNAPTGCSGNARTYVMLAPNVTKTYPVDSFPVSTTVNMTITLINTNDFVLRNGAFQDNLPFGMSLASLPFGATCPGVFPPTPSGFVNSSETSFQVLGVNLPPLTTCSFSLTIFAAFPGSTRNSITVISENAPAAQLRPIPYAEVYVMNNINVNPRYADPTMEVNGTTTLIIGFNNTNNNFEARCISFNETLDSKLLIVSINTTGAVDGMNMTTNATFYGNTFAIENVTLGPLQGFEIRIVVKGLLPGNISGPIIHVTTCNTPLTSSIEPTVYIMQCPNVSLSYGASSIPVGGTTSFNITLYNPSDFSIQDAMLTNPIPIRLAITSTIPLIQGGLGCGVASVAGQNFVISGATILPRSSCSYILQSLTGPQFFLNDFL
jgi:hypothetical protein